MSDNKTEYIISLKDLFSKGIQDADRNASKLESTMGSLRNTLAAVGVTVGIGAMIKGIVEVGASFEMAEVQLTTLLKSSKEAKVVFNDLKQEATTSPFGFDTLLKGNAALISTGIAAKDAKKDFNALANAVAATGGTEDTLQRMVFNLQQIKNTGKATAIDIKQFGMAGINIFKILNDYYAKNNIAAKQQVGNYEQITGALKLAASAGGDYFGALENMSKTTSGQLSNLKDAITNLAYDIFVELKPAIDWFIKASLSLIDLVKSSIEWIKKHARIIKFFAVAIMAGATALYAYRAALVVTKAISNTLFLVDMIKYIASTQSMSLATAAWSVAQNSLNLAMLANPIAIVVAAVALLVAGLVVLIDKYQEVDNIYNKSQQEFKNKGIEDETKAVLDLAKSYQNKNVSEKEAQTRALADREKALDAEEKYLLERQAGMREMLREVGPGNADLTAKLKGTATALEAVKARKSILSPEIFTKAKATKAGAKSVDTGTDSAKAPKHTVITINIDKLIEKFNISTSNLSESSSVVKEQIVKAMIEAVNDSQIVAGV